MKGKQIAFLVIVALALTGLLVQPVLAGSQTIDGIRFNGPNTRAQCVDATSNDTITITGLDGHNPAARVQGTVDIQYVLDNGGGRKEIKTFDVNSAKNVTLNLSYPPVSQWVANGSHEIHVDVSIKVFVGGKQVGIFDGQPNLGWDLYCTTKIITATATATRTATVQTRTPTQTATVRITTVTPTPTGPLQQRTTPTATRTEKPSNSGGGGTTPEAQTVAATATPAGPTPAAIPVTGGTADASMSALAMIMLLGLGMLGAGWALKQAVK